ncbi:hypothetical protein BC829DRAFT_111513 [Chytridium lagenaria]|nr:hypothetical protein BC829DRAFT_111513 [Chytridium lagenaria]
MMGIDEFIEKTAFIMMINCFASALDLNSGSVNTAGRFNDEKGIKNLLDVARDSNGCGGSSDELHFCLTKKSCHFKEPGFRNDEGLDIPVEISDEYGVCYLSALLLFMWIGMASKDRSSTDANAQSWYIYPFANPRKASLESTFFFHIEKQGNYNC